MLRPVVVMGSCLPQPPAQEEVWLSPSLSLEHLTIGKDPQTGQPQGLSRVVTSCWAAVSQPGGPPLQTDRQRTLGIFPQAPRQPWVFSAPRGGAPGQGLQPNST